MARCDDRVECSAATVARRFLLRGECVQEAGHGGYHETEVTHDVHLCWSQEDGVWLTVFSEHKFSPDRYVLGR